MMEGQNPDMVSVKELAQKLSGIYEEFTDSVKALGAKGTKRSGKFGASMAHWVGGSHVTTDREGLCEKFLADVQGHLELFLLALEDVPEAEAAEAAGIAADIMMQPCPPKSDATTDLMKRAMVGQARPLLPFLTQEKLEELAERMKKSYNRWQRLPIEQEMIKEMERLKK